jgi:hypothetical protein
MKRGTRIHCRTATTNGSSRTIQPSESPVRATRARRWRESRKNRDRRPLPGDTRDLRLLTRTATASSTHSIRTLKRRHLTRTVTASSTASIRTLKRRPPIRATLRRTANKRARKKRTEGLSPPQTRPVENAAAAGHARSNRPLTGPSTDTRRRRERGIASVTGSSPPTSWDGSPAFLAKARLRYRDSSRLDGNNELDLHAMATDPSKLRGRVAVSGNGYRGSTLGARTCVYQRRAPRTVRRDTAGRRQVPGQSVYEQR